MAVVCVAAATLFAVALASPSQPSAPETEADLSKTLQKRDYKAPAPVRLFFSLYFSFSLLLHLFFFFGFEVLF